MVFSKGGTHASASLTAADLLDLESQDASRVWLWDVCTCVQVSKGSQYPTLLKALIVQSMIKIEEDKVTVICREADIEAVKSVVDVSDEPRMYERHGRKRAFAAEVLMGSGQKIFRSASFRFDFVPSVWFFSAPVDACIAPHLQRQRSGPVLFVNVCVGHASCVLRSTIQCFFASNEARSLFQQDAVAEYVNLMKTQAGVDKVPVVTVEEDPAKCLAASW